MKVFLSSTAQDLAAFRKIADDTILRLSQQSVAMERFGPLPGMPVDECERLARESNLVVCIVAHPYGFVPELAQRDLSAIHRIATRSGMRLHLADYYLEFARLQLAEGYREKAREHSATAKKMIDDMGYHRRDKEVEEIEKQLA